MICVFGLTSTGLCGTFRWISGCGRCYEINVSADEGGSVDGRKESAPRAHLASTISST